MKRQFSLIRFLMAGAFTLLFLCGFSLKLLAAPPTVTWSPTGLSVELEPDQEETYIATLTVVKPVKHAVLQVTPGLASYVTADPAELGNIAKAASIDVDIRIAVSVSSPAACLVFPQPRASYAFRQTAKIVCASSPSRQSLPF
jgi:hypothetical protein